MKITRKNFYILMKSIEKSIDYYSNCVSVNGMEKDDIKQEILLRSFIASKKYNSKYAYKSFFMPVIKNEVRRLVKSATIKYRKNEEFISTVANNNLDVHNVDFDRIIFNEKFKDFVNDVANNLYGKYRQVFLYLIEGKTFKEIASIFNNRVTAIYGIRDGKIRPICKRLMLKHFGEYVYSF